MVHSSVQPVRSRLGRRALLSLVGLAAAMAAGIAVWPSLQPTFDQAVTAAGRADARLLVLAGLLFAAAPAGCGLVWQHAISRAGGRLGQVDACARYGVGSLINSFAPAHLGDVARTALLLKALPPGGRRRIVTCFGTIQAARIATLGGLALAAMLPTELALLTLVPLAAVLGVWRGASRLVILSLASCLAKVAAVATVLVALDAPSPIRAALAVVPALELAALLPLTPGNIGLASAAAAVALHTRGLATSEAVEAGIILHVVQTAAGVAYGTVSALALLSLVWLRRRTFSNGDIQLTAAELQAAGTTAKGREARALFPAKKVFSRLWPVRAPRAATQGG
jgi:uncharacterized membrane protein YbhN (UPF0104 family)